MKTCTKCNEAKALDAFSKDARATDGLYSSCKSCNAAYYAANSGRVRARVRAYQNANPERERLRGAAWRQKNPEKYRASIDRWEKSHPERLAASQAKHHAAHPNARRLRNVKWEKANPESVAASKARRRARVLNAPGAGVTAAEWRETLAESLGLCVYCNEHRTLEMEHVDPLSRGGAHEKDNIAAACLPCNRSKSDTPLLVWMAQRAASRTLAVAA